MKQPDGSLATRVGPPAAQDSGSGLDAKAGELLPLFDIASVLLAASLSLSVSSSFVAIPTAVWSDWSRLVWMAAVLAPFILYEPRFVADARAGRYAMLTRRYARRFLVLLATVCAFAYAGRWLDAAPLTWLTIWLLCTMLTLSGSRVLLARTLRHNQRPGIHAASGAALDPLVGDTWPVQLLADRPIRRWNAVLKASSDFLLGTFVTLLLLPVLAAIALAIRLDSPGPILFRQRRHGYNNSEFDIYKFRTMRAVPHADDAVLQQTVRGDVRVTRVGRFLRKWSLDELPQVLNVLQGDMSLVGPRPHAINMRTEQRYCHEITDFYAHRHRVKPGITGWAQINGSRGAIDTAEQLRRRIELDLYYVDHWSPLLDLKILALTAREVLRATNAY